MKNNTIAIRKVNNLKYILTFEKDTFFIKKRTKRLIIKRWDIIKEYKVKDKSSKVIQEVNAKRFLKYIK